MAYRKPYSVLRSSSRAPRPARWMDLRYAGRCEVCGGEIPAGKSGFYDPADKSICCRSITCADQVGLTTETWHGSPVSGQYVKTFSPTRIGAQRERSWKERYGQCEDAPCCGCCS